MNDDKNQDGFFTGVSVMSRRTFLILLAVLFCAANLTRWGFRSQYEHPRFMAEGAAHYRYTVMAARGEAVPALDRKAQWFEGLRVYHETSIGMEYLYGTIYRLIPGRKPGLPSFIGYFTAFFFSLAIWPLAFLSVRLWRSYGAGRIPFMQSSKSRPMGFWRSEGQQDSA